MVKQTKTGSSTSSRTKRASKSRSNNKKTTSITKRKVRMGKKYPIVRPAEVSMYGIIHQHKLVRTKNIMSIGPSLLVGDSLSREEAIELKKTIVLADGKAAFIYDNRNDCWKVYRAMEGFIPNHIYKLYDNVFNMSLSMGHGIRKQYYDLSSDRLDRDKKEIKEIAVEAKRKLYKWRIGKNLK